MKLRRRHAGRQFDDAVLHVAVLRDHDGQCALRFELDEFDMLQRHLVLGGKHQSRPARHARQHLARLGQHVLQRRAAAGCLDLRLDDAAFVV